MASREVLVVLVVCAAVSIQAAPLASNRFLRAALSPLLNQKRYASFDNAVYSSIGNRPGYGPSFNPPAGAVAAMELMGRGCDDPLIGELGIAVTMLLNTHFLQSAEMQGALGAQAGMVNEISPQQIGATSCIIGNIESLKDVAALMNYEEGSQEAQMLPIMYEMYVTMATDMVNMLEGQKELIDDPQVEEGIDRIMEIWDILKRMGLLNLE